MLKRIKIRGKLLLLLITPLLAVLVFAFENILQGSLSPGAIGFVLVFAQYAAASIKRSAAERATAPGAG